MTQILKVITGSHAYGLARPDSDTDYRGVYVADKGAILAPFNAPQSQRGEGDDTSYELRHFVKMAAQANPNVLEMLFVPARCHHLITPLGQRLLDNRNLFLSKRIITTFIGFSESCVKRMNSGHTQTGDRKEIKEHGFDTKYAMHAIRVLTTGAVWLSVDGILSTDVTETIGSDFTENLKEIRNGSLSKEQCMEAIVGLRSLLNEAQLISKLPDEPDIAAITKLCIDITEEAWS